MNRAIRKKCAEETVEILNKNFYMLNDQKVELNQLTADSGCTEVIGAEEVVDFEFREIVSDLEITVSNETSVAAIHRLASSTSRLGCLNFASAYNPGGGFLNGSEAQEESLARSSSLYQSLIEAAEYYTIKRNNGSRYYTDTLIYSPNVVVFRNNEGELLSPLNHADFITSPAVNLNKAPKEEIDEVKIEEVMKRRMYKILSLAAGGGINRLILGAWGCGVFKQKPENVALWFKESLYSFPQVFHHVHFAVLDNSDEQKTFKAFKNTFQKK